MNTKKNGLIKNFRFQVLPIKKEGILGSYRVEVHIEKCSAWYRKKIIILHYKFGDAKINRLIG